MSLLYPGEMRGLIFLDPTLQSTSFLRALLDGTVVYQIPSRHVAGLAHRYPALLIEAYAALAGRLVRSYDTSEALCFDPVKVRLVRLLVDLARSNEARVAPLSYEDPAQFVPADQATVGRLLAELLHEGLIHYAPHHRDRRILIPDIDRLIKSVALTDRDHIAPGAKGIS